MKVSRPARDTRSSDFIVVVKGGCRVAVVRFETRKAAAKFARKLCKATR